jgi:hypothetical protein
VASAATLVEGLTGAVHVVTFRFWGWVGGLGVLLLHNHCISESFNGYINHVYNDHYIQV